MNILCNLPLECFEARERFAQRIVTFGPPDRMWVEGVFYPFDVAFDPSRESIDDLFERLPADFRPDVVLFYWPDQEPLPAGLENCSVPVVGVLSDYNLALPYIAGLWPFFDVLLTDRPGVQLFERLSFADVRAFCQFSFKPQHRLYPDEVRSTDIAFCGNLSPVVQRERAPWIERVRSLASRGIRTDVCSGVFGEDYGRLLSRARIGFNRSIRGEMNMRAFEVPACGALLLMESSNLEVREFLEPDEEVVLYDDDNFEAIVTELLDDEPRRARIAAAGHRRIQDHRMSQRLAELERVLGAPGPGRPTSTPFDRALGRGIATLSTWAHPSAALRCLIEAQKLAPEDPRPVHGLAFALLRQGSENAQRAADLLRQACSLSPTYLPAARNLGFLLERAGRSAEARALQAEVERRRAGVHAWADIDGPALPGGWSESGIALSARLRQAVLADDASARLHVWS